MAEAKPRTIAQLQEFLDVAQAVIFSGRLAHSDAQRYEHITVAYSSALTSLPSARAGLAGQRSGIAYPASGERSAKIPRPVRQPHP